MAVKKPPKDIKKHLAILAAVITAFLLMTVILFGFMLDYKREDYLDQQFERLSRDFTNMQTLSLLSETYDDETMACLAFESKISEMDEYVWDLGSKIDDYRVASEEFQKDPYYIQQKTTFNENELYYFLLLKRMISKCNLNKGVILFFYQNDADCPKCDDQSFILTDISVKDEKDEDREIAVFSFDMDLNISSLEVLAKYYEIEEYPCLVINEKVYCGIRGEKFLLEKVCDSKVELNICS